MVYSTLPHCPDLALQLGTMRECRIAVVSAQARTHWIDKDPALAETTGIIRSVFLSPFEGPNQDSEGV